jgi:outer membrane protein assembly factor BamB
VWEWRSNLAPLEPCAPVPGYELTFGKLTGDVCLARRGEQLAAVDPTGVEHWQVKVAARGFVHLRWIDSDLLMLSDAWLSRIDVASGRENWSRRVRRADRIDRMGHVLVLREADTAFGDHSAELYAVDAKTGADAWSLNASSK